MTSCVRSRESVCSSISIDRVGLNGTVQAFIKIRGSQVVDVQTVSGPKEHHKYVQAAVKRMRCSAGGANEVQVSLPVNFVKGSEAAGMGAAPDDPRFAGREAIARPPPFPWCRLVRGHEPACSAARPGERLSHSLSWT